LNDLLGRDEHPVVLQPRVPAILGIPFVTLLDLEFRLDGVSDPAAEQRFRICLAMKVLVVVRASEIFEPSLVGAVRPVATGEKLCRQRTSTIAATPAAILRTDMGRPSDLVIEQFFLLLARYSAHNF
jgi:hypothetical protein